MSDASALAAFIAVLAVATLVLGGGPFGSAELTE
jgi:hypothetical protein